MGRAMTAAWPVKCSPSKNASDSAADISVTSWMDLSFTVTARTSGFRRLPPQVGHGTMAK